MTPAIDSPDGSATSIRYQVLAWLCLASALAYLQRNCVSVAESTIRGELELTKEQMGWILSGFFWSYASFQVPAGWLGDRWGSRLTLPLYSGVWSGTTALSALAGTFVTVWLVQVCDLGSPVWFAWLWLLAFRLIAGVSQAGLFPCAAVILSRWGPSTWLGMGGGLLGSSMQVGAIAAAFLTGVLLERGLSWQTVFLLFALPGGLWSIFFYRWFRDSPSDHAKVNAEELALISDPGGDKKEESKDEQVEAANSRTPWLELATSPPLWCICGQQFCRAAGYIFFASWFPTFLQESRGVSLAESGILTAVPLLAVLIGSPLGGLISDRIYAATGSANIARRGMAVVCMIAATLLMVAACLLQNPHGAVAMMAAGAFCLALAGPLVYSVTIEMGGRSVATAFGIMNMSGNLGAAAFPAVVPFLLGPSQRDWSLVLVIFCLLFAAASVFWMLLKPHGTFESQSLLRK